MEHLTLTRLGHLGRSRSLVFALAATLALAIPAAAQEDGSPAPEADASGIAFPVMLGGQLLTPETYSGSEWLARFSEGDEADPAFVAGTEALVAEAGAAIDDLTVKSALYEPVPGEAAVVMALRLAGTESWQWVEDAVELMVADVVEPGLVMHPLDTKWTLRVTDATMPGVYPRTVYLKDDTAWFIQGDAEYLWDALGQLPDADPVGASSADSLIADFPVTLDGARRSGLYELTEPLGLPTLGERWSIGVKDWLLDTYLATGITPAEMLGAIAWWAVDPSGLDGIQIEGYRLPEGGAEMTRRLLEDVLLARPPEVSVDPEAPGAEEIDELSYLLEGVSFSEEEIAGQQVTVLDFGGARQYLFGSADTVWVVSDPLGEPERVEEAIAALS